MLIRRLAIASMLLATPATAATLIVPDDLAGQLTQLHDDLLAIQGLLKPSVPAAPVAAPAGTLAAVEAGAGTAYPTIASALTACLPTGCTITLRDGTYAEVNHIGIPNVTIQAKSRRKAVLDGGGGCPTPACAAGTPGRLAYGKGVLHDDQAGFHLVGVVVTGGGGRNGKAEGEAGVYVEGAAATALLEDVQIDGNADGIHTAGGAAVTVRNSEWNVAKSNGQTKDGLSHDVYASFGTYAESGCFHYGNDYGNIVKVRQVVATSLTGGLYTSTQGRALDNTSGGNVALNGITISVPAGTVGNVLGYADENTLAGIGTFTMTGGTLVLNRSPSRIFMPNGGALAASGVAQFFGPGVSLEVDGTGTATGLAMSGPATAQPALPTFNPTAK